MNYRYILFIGLLGILFGCEPELDDFSASNGNADFSTYVALGNSLTAGYADGALYISGQENSYPNILATQFSKVGGGDFKQPLMLTEDGVGFTIYPTGIVYRTKTILGYSTDCLENTSIAPVPAINDPDQDELQGILSQPITGVYNNLGVPGAKSFHLIPAPPPLPPGIYSDPENGNPYYARFASNPGQSVLIGEAIALNPTFYSLWIGNNDVLGYATSGGVGDEITDQATFEYAMNLIVQSLDATGAKGAIANIPEITAIPFFNTVPPNAYVITQDQADTLNKYLGPLGFSYQEGPNYFIIEDANAPLGFRQMVEGELLLLTLPQDSLKCAFWGGYNPEALLPVPIANHYVLSADELTEINNAVSGYNQTISTLAAQYNLALVDMNAEFNKLKTGVTSDGITLTADFITGNAFSLDGVHGTQMGYSHVANIFISAINAKYGSNLSVVSLTSYPANVLP